MIDDHFSPSQPKTSNSGIIIFIVILLFLFLLAGGSLYYLYTQGYFSSTITPAIEMISIYVNPLDYQTHQSIALDYRLFEGQKIQKCLEPSQYKQYQENITKFYQQFPVLSKKGIDDQGCYVEKVMMILNDAGKLTNGLNSFNLKKQTIYALYYGSPDYYVGKIVWLGSIEDNTVIDGGVVVENKTVEAIFAHAIEKELNITIWGEIKPNYPNNIRVHLSGQHQLRDITLCFEWSYGIIDIDSRFDEVYTPKRLVLNSNKCVKVNENLNQSNEFQADFDFQVKTGGIIDSDFLKVYVIDKDTYLKSTVGWDIGFEDNLGQDIGAPDLIKIKYLNT